jgi:hypothetical protein
MALSTDGPGCPDAVGAHGIEVERAFSVHGQLGQSGFLVTGFDQDQQASMTIDMLLQFFIEAFPRDQVPGHAQEDLLLEGDIDVLEPPVLCDHDQPRMEGIAGLDQSTPVFAVGASLHLPQRLPCGFEERGVSQRYPQFEGGALERRAQGQDLVHVAAGEGRDEGALPRLGDHEPLPCKRLQRTMAN